MMKISRRRLAAHLVVIIACSLAAGWSGREWYDERFPKPPPACNPAPLTLDHRPFSVDEPEWVRRQPDPSEL